MYDDWAYVFYNKSFGWVELVSIVTGGEFTTNIISYSEYATGLYKNEFDTVALYKEATDKSEKICDIPENTEMDVCMIIGDYAFVTYKNYKGFVNINDLYSEEFYARRDVGTYRMVKDVPVYTDDSFEEEMGITYNKGDALTVYISFLSACLVKIGDDRWGYIDEEDLEGCNYYFGTYVVNAVGGAKAYPTEDAAESSTKLERGSEVVVAYAIEERARIYSTKELWVDMADLTFITPEANIKNFDDSLVFDMDDSDTDSNSSDTNSTDTSLSTDSSNSSDINSEDTDTSDASDNVNSDTSDVDTDSSKGETDTEKTPDEKLIIGDADQSGAIDMKDVTYIQKFLADLVTFKDDNASKCADVTGDGKINLEDVTTIQKYLAELITVFPASSK